MLYVYILVPTYKRLVYYLIYNLIKKVDISIEMGENQKHEVHQDHNHYRLQNQYRGGIVLKVGV